jgi:peptidoglycan/xylan/chitin deacetylase (PgdA/CDA1 family)
LGVLTCITAQTASAANCPGHPDALGTSRTLVVDPREHPRIGTMQYPETLPLEDHEVVLTFDDGPLPHNSNQVLDILASQCVKATFFTIGRMAQAYPEGVRKLRDAGHSIGAHTQNHPLSMNRMPVERARQEIDDGIASVKAALGDDAALAPFFRIPGLSRADGVESRLPGHPDLERRFSGRRLAAYFVIACLRHRDEAARGQGKRHSAIARHPGANRRRVAEDSA